MSGTTSAAAAPPRGSAPFDRLPDELVVAILEQLPRIKER